MAIGDSTINANLDSQSIRNIITNHQTNHDFALDAGNPVITPPAIIDGRLKFTLDFDGIIVSIDESVNNALVEKAAGLMRDKLKSLKANLDDIGIVDLENPA